MYTLHLVVLGRRLSSEKQHHVVWYILTDITEAYCCHHYGEEPQQAPGHSGQSLLHHTVRYPPEDSHPHICCHSNHISHLVISDTT
jgi:hypothetical protein